MQHVIMYQTDNAVFHDKQFCPILSDLTENFCDLFSLGIFCVKV